MTQSANYDMVLYSTLTLPKYCSNHQCLLVPSIPSALSSWKTNCVASSQPSIFDKCLQIMFWLSGLVMHSEVCVSVLAQVWRHHTSISTTGVIPWHHSLFQMFFKSNCGTFWCLRVSARGDKPCFRSKPMFPQPWGAGLRMFCIFPKKPKKRNSVLLHFQHTGLWHQATILQFSIIHNSRRKLQKVMRFPWRYKKKRCKYHSVTLWCWATRSPAPAGPGVSDSALRWFGSINIPGNTVRFQCHQGFTCS